MHVGVICVQVVTVICGVLKIIFMTKEFECHRRAVKVCLCLCYITAALLFIYLFILKGRNY